MNKSKISILGCGWLGLPLAKHFIEEGCIIKGSTTRIERMPELSAVGVQPYLLKADNKKWLGDKLQDFLDCDVLIIAIPPGTRRNPDSTHAEEIEALMQYIADAGISIMTVIYMSSTSVYRSLNSVLVESDIEGEATSENKVLFRAEAHIKSSVIANKIILRLGGLTGYERMLARFFAGKKELSGGNEPVNLVHRDDVISAVLFLLQSNSKSTILNVCSPKHPLRKDFYTQLCNRFELAQPFFSEQLNADWKEISSEKLSDLGYSWIFPDPTGYTYTY